MSVSVLLFGLVLMVWVGWHGLVLMVVGVWHLCLEGFGFYGSDGWFCMGNACFFT